jgi:hypothetical protein
MTNKLLNRYEILNAIRRTASELGKNPSRSEFSRHTRITEYNILKLFSNWNSAVEAAGLKPNTTHGKIDDYELLADWGKLVRELRKIPTRVKYKQQGKFSSRAFENHFGPWSGLPDKFREFAKEKNEWNDVIALLAINKPTYTISPPIDIHKHSQLQRRTVYGNHIDFRGLRPEPANENGVIFLFDIVARELGYSFEAVQTGFPDCEAKRQIAAGKWQSIRIEFEYESRDFSDKGNPVDSCDVIVCWRHNWPDCPSRIAVVELSEVIKQLTKSDE